MKRSILYLLFAVSALFSCENKDDTVFEETADARLNATIAAYEKQLVEAPYGWNAVIYPGLGGSFGFYFKFNNQNRVVMYSDFTAESAAKSKESSYRLKALQTPALIFDTYSYLHVLADPDNNVNGGAVGAGLVSDFEFSIFPDSVSADVITLVGRQNGSRLVLTKATQAQATSYEKGDLAKSLLFDNILKYQTYFKRVTLGAETYEVTVNPTTRNMTMTWLDGTTPRQFSTSYYYTSTGLVFAKPLVNGSQTISGFTNILWNANSLQLTITGGGATAPIVSAIKPLAVDLNASKRWWQAPIEAGGDWRSLTGFHINGVDDAYGLSKLTGEAGAYAFLLYQPGYNSRYDLFGPVFFADNAITLDYGYAPTPNFTSDGRVVFTQFGTFGTVPASGPAFNTANLLYESAGYYLIQTSPETYDMVSAKDARSWVSWQ